MFVLDCLICERLFVRNAIFMLVFLKMLVICVVSFPVYVNVAHFWSWVVGVSLWLRLCGLCFIRCVGNWLLCRMLWMVFSSFLYSSVCSPYVFSLLYRYLIVANLCCGGWLDV